MTITKVEAVAALRDLVESLEALSSVKKMFGEWTRDEWKAFNVALKLARRWVDAADGPKAIRRTKERSKP